MSATATEEQVALERRRTVWDVIFGILMVIAGVFLLGNVVLPGSAVGGQTKHLISRVD